MTADLDGGERTLQARIRFSRRQNGGTAFELDVDLTVEPGFTILFGPSGAGKSTLLDCLAGLERAGGRVVLASRVLQDSDSGIFKRPQERCLAYLFQAPALFPHMTVEENVAFGLPASAVAQRKTIVESLLEMFRVAPLARRRPPEISGGEAQRVALARALAPAPRAVLLDEPLTGLDAELKSSIVEDLRAWNAARPVPILYVTHHRDEVDALGEHVIAMDRGRVVSTGIPHAVLDAPRSRRLARVAGFENHLSATVLQVLETDGVMRARIGESPTELEIPLADAAVGDRVHIAIRAGDILLASVRPAGLSARNLIEGRVESVELRGAIAICRIRAGVDFLVHVTPGTVRTLEISAGKQVWMVVKTHSCRLVEG